MEHARVDEVAIHGESLRDQEIETVKSRLEKVFADRMDSGYGGQRFDEATVAEFVETVVYLLEKEGGVRRAIIEANFEDPALRKQIIACIGQAFIIDDLPRAYQTVH